MQMVLVVKIGMKTTRSMTKRRVVTKAGVLHVVKVDTMTTVDGREEKSKRMNVIWKKERSLITGKEEEGQGDQCVVVEVGVEVEAVAIRHGGTEVATVILGILILGIQILGITVLLPIQIT